MNDRAYIAIDLKSFYASVVFIDRTKVPIDDIVMMEIRTPEGQK